MEKLSSSSIFTNLKFYTQKINQLFRHQSTKTRECNEKQPAHACTFLVLLTLSKIFVTYYANTLFSCQPFIHWKPLVAFKVGTILCD